VGLQPFAQTKPCELSGSHKRTDVSRFPVRPLPRKERQTGSVTVGKSVDRRWIKGDPSKQISDIETVEIVFKDDIGI